MCVAVGCVSWRQARLREKQAEVLAALEALGPGTACSCLPALVHAALHERRWCAAADVLSADKGLASYVEGKALAVAEAHSPAAEAALGRSVRAPLRVGPPSLHAFLCLSDVRGCVRACMYVCMCVYVYMCGRCMCVPLRR